MYNKIIFIGLFITSISMYSQSNNISIQKIYKKLSKKEIQYVQFEDSFNLTEGKQIKNKQEVDFLLLDICTSQQLKFKNFTYNNPNPPFFRDSLFLFKEKYCVDNLFYEKRLLKNEKPLRLNYASGYSFSLNSKNYISLFFWDSTIPTSNLRYFIILFDISDVKNIKPYFFYEQMSFTPDCFGDFNNDGVLDFANWSYSNKLECFTLVGNKFKRIKNKIIITEEKSANNYSINLVKSKWFKRLLK
ncbi:hypothetical protein ACHRV6_14825 [Flavobacterium sp. FlaQc-51]|uniref:hypothetical protein n=1 Tax=unclassified Flavobacterium TaxID=196869 RepID=UPI000ACFFAC9|nr:hypothetical protein [Flavobacterium sp. Leaf82]